MTTDKNNQEPYGTYYGGKLLTFNTVAGYYAWNEVRCWATIVYIRSLYVTDSFKRSGKERQFNKRLKQYATRMAKHSYQLMQALEDGHSPKSETVNRIRKRRENTAKHYLQSPKIRRKKPRQKKLNFFSKPLDK
jgi:hypothetical protein